MIDFTLEELAGIAGATLHGANLTIHKVSTDSRKCAGALFVALRGERFDGHDFIADAVKNGAVAVGVDHGAYDVPTVTAASTLELLGFAGLLVRRKCPAKILSLTGTCGKTTVKELTASILRLRGKTLATSGNFNNDVGVPLTLLNLEDSDRYAVIEQGASHPLDIAHTARFVEAEVGLINNVGNAHLEGFGSLDGVYHGKSEILQSVFSRGGTGIIPADSPYYEKWRTDFAAELAAGRLISFGTSDQADVRIGDFAETADGSNFTMSTRSGQIKVTLRLLGLHNALNAAAAAALCLSAGIELPLIREGLERASAVGGRLDVYELPGLKLIDDAYNASYNAVLAGIEVLSHQQGRRILVLGDMGELGTDANALHESIGPLLAGKVDCLLALGDLTKLTVAASGGVGEHFATAEELFKRLQEIVGSGEFCTVLVKGSHAMHMDRICTWLKDQGEENK